MTDIDELESKIDDIEFDTELKFDEIENKIKKIKTDMNVWDLFSKYTIPYSYKKELISIQKRLRYIKFDKYVDKYISKSNMNVDIPILYNLDNSEKLDKIIFKNSTNLKNSKIFLDISKNLYWDIKPILSYYSVSYLFSSFIGFFNNFKNFRGHHGIKISQNGNDPYKIEIKFQKSGLFQRIVKTFSYIFDYSIFADYYVYPESKLVDTKKFLSIKNENKFSINYSSFLLEDLINGMQKNKVDGSFNFLKRKKGYHSFYSSKYFTNNSMILRDYILIFVACNLSRYNHYIWKNIYEGQLTDIFLHFQNAINNIDEMVNYLSYRFNEIDKLIRYF